MRKYLTIVKNSLTESIAFRSSFFFNVFGNFFYIFLLYFLWKAIYQSTGSGLINGMSFQDTYLYLCLANILLLLFSSGMDYWMAGTIASGDIILTLVRPLDWQFHLMCIRLGNAIFSFMTVTVPAFIFISFVVHPGIRLGINLFFFLPSCFLAFVVSYLFDFFVGLIAFYTTSFWGFSVIKNFGIRAVSGSIVPLALFPGFVKEIVAYLPFKAIYDVPVRLLIDRSWGLQDMLAALAFQAAWFLALFMLSRFAFNRAVNHLCVQGG